MGQRPAESPEAFLIKPAQQHPLTFDLPMQTRNQKIKKTETFTMWTRDRHDVGGERVAGRTGPKSEPSIIPAPQQ